MKIREILNLYSKNILYETSTSNNFRKKIENKLKNDISAKKEKVETFDDFVKVLHDIGDLKNTRNIIDLYKSWIFKNYANNNLGNFSNVKSKVLPALEKFYIFKSNNVLQPEHKNIENIENFAELKKILSHYSKKQ